MIKNFFKLIIATILISTFNIEQVDAGIVNIPDINLKKCINDSLGLGETTEEITDTQLKTLTTLSCNNKTISDLSGIENAINLTKLSLFSNQISDVTSLNSLTNITELSLNNNSITDISALSGLNRVRLLQLDNNNISDISALGGLNSLRYLYLANNSISDITSISSLINLLELFLQANNISDITTVSNFTKLLGFSIDSNNVEDISVLGGLTQLKQLYISDNKIKDINAVSNLVNLNILYSSENQIDDASPIGNLPNLYDGGLYNQLIFKEPLYVDSPLSSYPNRNEEIILDDGTIVSVLQSYNSTNNSYEGTFNEKIYNNLGTFSGKIVSPVLVTSNSTDVIFTSTSYTVDERYAPTSIHSLLDALNVRAYDPAINQEVTSSISISDLDGYDISNPQVGTYNIIYNVTGANGTKVFADQTITVSAMQSLNNFAITNQVIADEDGDLKANLNEQLTYQVKVKNLNNVDVLNPIIMVNLNNTNLDIATINNIKSSGITVNVVDDDLYIYPSILRVGEEITITYDITTKNKWYLNTTISNLGHFDTIISVALPQELYSYLDKTPVKNERLIIENNFTITESSNNGLINENEIITFTNHLKNSAMYTLKKFSVKFDCFDTRILQDYHNVYLASNSRDLIEGVDYEVLANNQINIFDFEPDEVITYSVDASSTNSFESTEEILFTSSYEAYMLDMKTIVLNETQTTNVAVELIEDVIMNIESLQESYDENGNITYNVSITNTGNVTQENLIFTYHYDNLVTDGTLHNIAVNPSYVINKNTVTIKKLLPGETINFVFDVKADFTNLSTYKMVDQFSLVLANGNITDNQFIYDVKNEKLQLTNTGSADYKHITLLFLLIVMGILKLNIIKTQKT